MSFDPANRRSSVASHNRISSASTITSLSAEILALSAVSNLFSSVVSIMRPDLPLPSTPKFLPKSASPRAVLDSPAVIFNTPSKLERFLQDAESNGIPGVQTYDSLLLLKGYGPDILHLVNVQDLVEIGVSPGDAIWLREYAAKWWVDERRRASKRPRAPDADKNERRVASPSAFPPAAGATPPNKRLRFEKRYFNGGGCTTHGRTIVNGNGNGNDFTWWVYSQDLKMDVPLPPGKVPVLAEDPPFIDEDGNVF
jgi:hypothetical protein